MEIADNNCSEFIVKQFMEIWRNSDRNKPIENVKSSGFCRKTNAACRAFSVIYIYLIWKYEVMSKKNMLLDISVYGMGLPYPASTYKLREKDEIFVR
jgi:hypothetical protein